MNKAPDEYVGKPYHEKTIHKTHFDRPALKLRTTRESMFEWIEIRPGHWRLVKKEIQNGN